MVSVYIFVLGLCFGSFANALVWRLHEQSKTNRKSKVESRKLSIIQGRSMCTNCKHVLAWHDLIPVLSWLSLGGKCRYCHKPISWQYPVVELSTAALFVASYVFWPHALHTAQGWLLFGLWLVFIVGFMALAVYDLRWMILPNRLIFPLQFLAIIFAAVSVLVLGDGLEGIVGIILGVLCSAGLFYVLFQISSGRWIGGGDVKLAVILGLLLAGPAKVALMLFIASFIGSMISIPLLLLGKLKPTSHLPFGPMLIIATIIIYLFGSSIIDWYELQVLFL